MFQVQHYILVVQAQDNGHPSLSTTLTVYCNVLDLNDNAPVFEPMSYSMEIFENVPVGTEVLAVSASDLDSGKLYFFILNRVKKSVCRYFASFNPNQTYYMYVYCICYVFNYEN